MTAQWFSPPSKALDPNANPYSGAIWYFYVSGTLTPQNVYSDNTLGTSLGATVTADSAGKFVNIYFDTSLSYRAICKSSDGSVTLHDIPLVNSDALSLLQAASGDTLVTHTPEGTGAVARSVFSINRETKRLTDRLTTAEIDDVLEGTASTDITTKFNTAIADAAGARLVLPWGAIKVNTSGTALAVAADDVWIEGQATRLISAHLTSDIIQLGNGTNEISGFVMSDVTFWASVTKTGGYCVNSRLGTDCYYENVRLGSVDDYVANGNAHKLYNGVYFDRYSQIRWEGGEMVVSQSPVKARGNVDQTFGAEMTFDGGLNIKYSGTYAFLFGGGTGGVYLNQVSVSDCAGGCRWDKTLTAITNREVFLDDVCALDNLTAPAIYVASDGLETMDAHCWISNCGSVSSPGVNILAGTSVNATNIRVQSCPYDGIHIDGAAWTQAGGIIRSNGSGANGGHGVNFVSGRMTIANAIVHDNGSGTRGYGINLVGGCDNYTVIGNDFFSNGQGSILGGGASASKIILNNRGYAIDAYGGPLILPSYTASGLPSASTYPYAKAFVTDANSTTFNAAVVGGGSNKVPVWSDGSGWKIG